MKKLITLALLAIVVFVSCGNPTSANKNQEKFNYTVDRFADLQILRYQVPGFDELSLQQKKLIYFLSEAAQSGRDILFDQNGKYNLRIRRTLEAIYLDYKGDRTSDDFKAFEVYLKRVWFANGIHHHYGMDKFTPGFSEEFFKDVLLSVDENLLPIEEGNTIECLYKDIAPVIFDPTIKPKREIGRAHV